MANSAEFHLTGLLDQSALARLQHPDASASGLTAAPAQALYLTEPGESSAISVDDINQGSLNDCFVLAPIGEIAMVNPGFISNMIHVNSDGTETVTLYTGPNGARINSATSSFSPIAVTVTNVFPSNSVNSGANQDVVNGVKEIWPQVLEKAVAQLDGGYSAFTNGGYAVYAMEQLTGAVSTSMAASRVTLATLLSLSSAGDLLVMQTLSQSGLPDDLISNHDYMFDGVTGSGSNAAVNLLNPWGYDNPPPILFSQLSKGISSVEVGHLS